MSTVTIPHATWRTDYLLTSMKHEQQKNNEAIAKASEHGDYAYLLECNFDAMATSRARNEIISLIESCRTEALTRGLSQEEGDYKAIVSIVKQMLRVVLSSPINNSTSAVVNCGNESRILFARRVLDIIGIDGYQLGEGDVLDAMLGRIMPDTIKK